MALETLFPIVAFTGEELYAMSHFMVLAFGATLALILGVGKCGKNISFGASMVVLLASLACLLCSALPEARDIGMVLTLGPQSVMLSVVLHLVAMLALCMLTSQSKMTELLPEVYPLILMSLIGMLLLVSTQHLLFQFICIEIMSLAIYVLVAIRRESKMSAEASMKYFILGGVASAFFLFGSSLLFGASGSFDLRQMTAAGPHMLKTMGYMMVVGGLFFKVGAFPFHSWVADVYEGAMFSITGFMAAAVKLASFVVLSAVASSAIADSNAVYPMITVLFMASLFSMVYGNFVALSQKNVKRLLAYSSIAHTGYLILGVLAQAKLGSGSAMNLYLSFYAFATLGAFSVLMVLFNNNDLGSIEDLSGKGLEHPLMGIILTVSLLAMAGIPLTSGFIVKYLLFGQGVKAGMSMAVIAAVLTSLVSAYYYLKMIVALYMKQGTAGAAAQLSCSKLCGASFVGVVCLAITLYFGLMPSYFIEKFSTLWP